MQCTYKKKSPLSQINFLIPLFLPSNFSFLPSKAHLSNLTFQSLPLFTVRVLLGVSSRDKVFRFFFLLLCSLNSFGLIEQGGKLNRELSRLVPEISRIFLQQQEMVITVDQGIRLLPYGFAKYTVRVNHFHLYFLFVCQAVCLVSSPPKSEFRKRVKQALSFSFFVVSPPVRSVFIPFKHLSLSYDFLPRPPAGHM